MIATFTTKLTHYIHTYSYVDTFNCVQIDNMKMLVAELQQIILEPADLINIITEISFIFDKLIDTIDISILVLAIKYLFDNDIFINLFLQKYQTSSIINVKLHYKSILYLLLNIKTMYEIQLDSDEFYDDELVDVFNNTFIQPLIQRITQIYKFIENIVDADLSIDIELLNEIKELLCSFELEEIYIKLDE